MVLSGMKYEVQQIFRMDVVLYFFYIFENPYPKQKSKKENCEKKKLRSSFFVLHKENFNNPTE